MRATRREGRLVLVLALVAMVVQSQNKYLILYASCRPARSHSARHRTRRSQHPSPRLPARLLRGPPRTHHVCPLAPADLVQDIIRRAKRRIFLSSLYIGPAEHQLVRVLSFLSPPLTRPS